jgi:dihydroorotate dehydrogenase (fumarate)
MSLDLDTVRRLEDAGAAAIVMNSLFEEQIVGEQFARYHFVDARSNTHPESRSYFPAPREYALGPDEYVEQIGRIRKAVNIPVIGSLNGSTLGGWLGYARLIEQAGAHALELNVYSVASDAAERGTLIEERTVEMLQAVKRSVRIPVAVKLSPFYTSLAHFAPHLDGAGADGLVLFNRFYQPDLDAEDREVVQSLHLSDRSELLLRLRWLALLSGRVKGSLGATGGVDSGLDAIKAVMCGAHAVQMVSSLLRRGPEHLREVRAEMADWMERNEYGSLGQLLGSMNLARCPDPKAYERAQYVHILQRWRGYAHPPAQEAASWFE